MEHSECRGPRKVLPSRARFDSTGLTNDIRDSIDCIVRRTLNRQMSPSAEGLPFFFDDGLVRERGPVRDPLDFTP